MIGITTFTLIRGIEKEEEEQKNKTQHHHSPLHFPYR
jgi:hypothetical protein